VLTIPKKFIGLDLECTGRDHRLHKIIQIGLAVRTDSGVVSLKRDVKQVLYRYEEAALQVCKFTHERIAAGSDAEEAELRCLEFLMEHAPTPKRLIAVGWNVGGFDLQFIKDQFPVLEQRLHYRHVDLNSLSYLTAVVLQKDVNKIKKEAKTYAALSIRSLPEFQGVDDWHDAGYDSMASLYEYQYFINLLKSDEYVYTIFRNRIMKEEPWPDSSTSSSDLT
jgi:oligoribonuclease (3'-5' exoribonuclease)